MRVINVKPNQDIDYKDFVKRDAREEDFSALITESVVLME